MVSPDTVIRELRASGYAILIFIDFFTMVIFLD